MIPTAIHVKKQSLSLQLTYGTQSFELSFELLRVLSPSAEVRGHGGVGGQLPYGKKEVRLLAVEPAGNYALKLVFDDGHDSGLYDWHYLHHLCIHQDELWADYLKQLEESGKRRESSTINFRKIE